MNTNNLSWVDNKVLNNPSSTQNRQYQNQNTAPMRPFMDTMPAQYQEMPQGNSQAGTSPATYQNPITNTQNQTGLSPAQFQEPIIKQPSQMGTLPSSFQDESTMDPARMGVSQPSMQSPGMQGTLTRTEAHDTSPFNMEGPPTVMTPGYLPAYLKTIIGKRIRAEFVFQNLYLDKTGILREVGVNYFVLEDTATHAMIMCDLYSARFITSA
jgi:hypothetical protein